MEGDGPHYKQPRIEIRPRPQHSFDGRIYAVASSEDSVDSAAKLGAHMVMFADRPWEMRLPVIERGRELHRQYHGNEQPTLMMTEFGVCGPDLRTTTEDEARQYQGKFVESNFYHYEFLGEHFRTVKGYDSYQQKAEIARKAGGSTARSTGFMQAASWGTPDRILRGLEERRSVLGEFELNVAFRFGGTPFEVAERGLKLFAKEVLPVLTGAAARSLAGQVALETIDYPVMAGLDPAIHASSAPRFGVDARVKPGHDDKRGESNKASGPPMAYRSLRDFMTGSKRPATWCASRRRSRPSSR